MKDIKNAHILIVDDQILNIKLLKAILKKEGFTNIFTTVDSRESVSMFIEHKIDILLLDIRMPHLNGFEVMAQLNNTIKNDYLPILVLTAELTSETRAKALSSGAKDFLTKPFDRVEVVQRIQNILEVRLLHKQIQNQNQRLEIQVAERTAELEKSRYEVIERLGKAAEFKDNETGNHIIRMAKYSRLLAQAAGLTDEEVDLIYLAAPMHDIGKIGIPDHILLKPGKFEPEEWEIMKTHVLLGGDILSGSDDVPLLFTAKTIAMTHHEKWDGSGYPHGLSGEDIPIAGRICALTDVFDALTSERPYKKAWSIEKAIALLHDGSGKHFDPALIPLFELILDDIRDFRNQHLDVYPDPEERDDRHR